MRRWPVSPRTRLGHMARLPWRDRGWLPWAWPNQMRPSEQHCFLQERVWVWNEFPKTELCHCSLWRRMGPRDREGRQVAAGGWVQSLDGSQQRMGSSVLQAQDWKFAPTTYVWKRALSSRREQISPLILVLRALSRRRSSWAWFLLTELGAVIIPLWASGKKQ